MKSKRFTVVEYASGFAVRDNQTGREAWMSDGVDALTTPTGRSMRPGSEYFRKMWERTLNATPDETADAYFPE